MNKRLVIFASGSGTNAENLIQTYQNTELEVVGIFTNKPDAYVIERARKWNIPYEVFQASAFRQESFLIQLSAYKPDFIILAGFLLKVPEFLVSAYPSRIINIHPALLPKYGGKGMYGSHVHEAVIANRESISGITIHLVNEHYDEGAILFQATCPVIDTDTPSSLASKIHELEYLHFPQIISDYIRDFQG